MPTYDYQCESCNTEFSAFQTMSAQPFESCNDCGGKVQRRISGGTGLIFKGSGFYLTDYSKKKSKNNDSSKSNKSSNKESKTSTKEGSKS